MDAQAAEEQQQRALGKQVAERYLRVRRDAFERGRPDLAPEYYWEIMKASAFDSTPAREDAWARVVARCAPSNFAGGNREQLPPCSLPEYVPYAEALEMANHLLQMVGSPIMVTVDALAQTPVVQVGENSAQTDEEAVSGWMALRTYQDVAGTSRSRGGGYGFPRLRETQSELLRDGFLVQLVNSVSTALTAYLSQVKS